MEAYDEGNNTVVLSLRILDTELSDYGEYACVAVNALGRDQETVYLYGIISPSFNIFLCLFIFLSMP